MIISKAYGGLNTRERKDPMKQLEAKPLQVCIFMNIFWLYVGRTTVNILLSYYLRWMVLEFWSLTVPLHTFVLWNNYGMNYHDIWCRHLWPPQ